MISLAKKKQEKQSSGLEIPVEFGGVSIGGQAARLGIKVKKERLNIIAAEELFCGRRLSGLVQLGGSDDQEGQQKLFEADLTIEGTFDVHRFSVGQKEYSAGITFAKSEIVVGDLSEFSKGSGRLIVQENIEIPHDVVEEDEDSPETNQTLPGTFASDVPWRKYSLDSLFSGAILKALKGAGLSTVGDYSDFFQPNKSGFAKTLNDIKGLGPQKITQVEDRMIEFFRDNPQD